MTELQIIEPPRAVLAQVRPVPTLHGAIREHLEELKSLGYSASFIEGTKASLRDFERWMGTKPLSRETALAYRHHLDGNPNWTGRTAALAWGRIKRFLEWLVIAGYTHIQIAKGIRTPEAKPSKNKKTALTEAHYRKIMELETNPSCQWMFRMMWHTGMALVDAAGLQWSEVDMETGTITRVRQKTSATDRPCIIPFERHGEFWEALVERAKFRESEMERWPNINGKEYVHPQVWVDYMQNRIQERWVRTTRPKLGPLFAGYGLHSFRRGFVTRLAKGGINPYVGCQITGHKDPKMFTHYNQHDPEFIRAEAERALTEARLR